jgi:hypothetical protein
MEQYELLEKVVVAFGRLGIRYLVTGSVAAMAYGEPRLTNDVDIVAIVEETHIPGLLAEFPSAEYYIDEDMIKEAIHNLGQFNIIHPTSGLKVDVIIKRDTAFDESRFRRIRKIQPAPAYKADFASPEDVIVKKMEFYKESGHEKHLRDITGILKVSGDTVDRAYISQWVERLGLVDIWEAVQKRVREAP